MASSGSAYGRFRRALDNGNLLAARAAAVELNHVGLAEGLELTLLILAREPTRFRAAALRWHARYCGDHKVSIEEATAVLGLLAMLEGGRAKPAAQALAGFLDSRTLLPAAEVLVRWAAGADQESWRWQEQLSVRQTYALFGVVRCLLPTGWRTVRRQPRRAARNAATGALLNDGRAGSAVPELTYLFCTDSGLWVRT